MAAHGKKFSWMRLINNAVPNFAFDDPNDVDLSPSQADALLTYQLALPHTRYLSENAFFVASIVGSESVSRKVHRALVKHNIILPYPDNGEKKRKGSTASMFSMSSNKSAGPSTTTTTGDEPKVEGGGELMTVNTAGIGKGFASQVAVISVHAQRKLVGLLFFWEEECTRWKLLDEQEREILRALDMEGGAKNRDLDVALEAVEMKKRMLPSKRAEAVANVSQGQGHALPVYS